MSYAYCAAAADDEHCTVCPRCAVTATTLLFSSLYPSNHHILAKDGPVIESSLGNCLHCSCPCCFCRLSCLRRRLTTPLLGLLKYVNQIVDYQGLKKHNGTLRSSLK